MAARPPYPPLSDTLAPYTNPPPLQPYELDLFIEPELAQLQENNPRDSPATQDSQPEDQPDPSSASQAFHSLKRKRGRLKVASATKRPRLEESASEQGPSTPSHPTSTHRFTTSSTPIPASAMSHRVPVADRQFHDFQFKMLTLCGEFYDAATKLVEDASPEVINRCYRLHDPNNVNPLTILNEAKKTCDMLLQRSASSSAPRPSSAGPSPSTFHDPFPFISSMTTPQTSSPRPSFTSRVASSFNRPTGGGMSIFDSFMPASRRSPTATPVESSSPKRSLRSPTLFPQSQSQITQNQGPWTDQENQRLRKLAEHFKLPNGETDWQKVAIDFGPTRSKHQVLIKATSLGLKPSSTRPSRRPRDPATSSAGVAIGDRLRSPSRSASTPGAPTPGTSTVPLHSQRTPRTPVTPLEMGMPTSYPTHSVMTPQAISATTAAAGMPGMVWTTSPTSGNGYYRQRPPPQAQAVQPHPQPQMVYTDPSVTDDPQNNPFLWMQTPHQQTRSPSQEGQSHHQPRGYGF